MVLPKRNAPTRPKKRATFRTDGNITADMRVAENSVRRVIKLFSRFDERKLIDQEKRDLNKLLELSEQIRPIAAQNWDKEKAIADLDNQIGLILGLKNAKPKEQVKMREDLNLGSPFDGKKKEIYQEMFSLLLHEPKYLAKLAHKCPKVDCEDFVKTVVVDLFGGRPELEALCLQMFSTTMEIEFAKCQRSGDMGSLFRSGSAAMQMLKEYALQGDGKEIIRQMLHEPINSLCEHDLNLEVESIRMYKEFIKKYESDTHKTWPHSRDLATAEEAFNQPYIQKLYKPRVTQLKFIAEHFLKCVISRLETIPWGVRWICKELAKFGQEYFPNASPYQWGSIVGGFLFLRLLNPAIIAPQFYNIIPNKPAKNTGRTLQFTAKILMKLLNGTQFNEIHMTELNPFLREKKQPIQNFIVKLITVNDLDFRMDMYRLLKHNRQRDITIRTTYNQIILLHRLLKDNIANFNDPKDPLLPILMKLGPVMREKFRRKDNRTVTMHLEIPPDTFDKMESENTRQENLFKVGDEDPVIQRTLGSLRKFSQRIKMEDHDDWARKRDFLAFVEHIRDNGSQSESIVAQELIENLDLAVEGKNKELSETTGEVLPVSKFLINYSEQIKLFKNRVRRLSSHTKNVERALRHIKKHSKFLQQKYDAFKEVLDSMTQGNSQATITKEEIPNEITLTHQEMENKCIILWVHPDHVKNARKYIKYTFRRVGVGEYEVHVKATKMMFTVNVFDKPYKLSLIQLLDMENRGKDHFALEEDLISLNINFLTKFFHETFKDFAT